MRPRRRVVVVGGGPSGLAAAHRALELDPRCELTVLEARSAPGGWLRTVEADDCVIELGPDSILRESPAAPALVKRLGLESRVVSTRPDRHGAYVVRAGRLVRVPEGWSLLAPTDPRALARASVLSMPGRLRALGEVLVPPSPSGDVESLAAWERRRFGWEALERLAQPLAAGIYGGDPEALGLGATLPRFVAMERTRGSVLRALDAQRRAGREQASGARYSLFFAFDRGMQVLTDALAARVGARLRTGREARAIVRNEGGFRVETARDAFDADRLILAVASPIAARLVAGLDPHGAGDALATALDRIDHGSAATVTFTFSRAHVRHPLDAYGFVVPAVERRRILASTWSSEKWPGRAPQDRVILRVFVGGPGEDDVLDRDDDALARTALGELDALVGITGPPRLTRVVRYPRAMPRYAPEHAATRARVEAALARLPGLGLAGNGIAGVGIPHAIASGERAAELALADRSA